MSYAAVNLKMIQEVEIHLLSNLIEHPSINTRLTSESGIVCFSI